MRRIRTDIIRLALSEKFIYIKGEPVVVFESLYEISIEFGIIVIFRYIAEIVVDIFTI